jgi:hypothetical protein
MRGSAFRLVLHSGVCGALLVTAHPGRYRLRGRMMSLRAIRISAWGAIVGVFFGGLRFAYDYYSGLPPWRGFRWTDPRQALLVAVITGVAAAMIAAMPTPGARKRMIWAEVFAAALAVASVMAYEDLVLDRGIYGGGARLSSSLVIRFPPLGLPEGQYGIERESYWIDQAGECVIPYLDPRSIPPGYRHHICANLLVGDLRFPLPLRPWADALIAVLAVEVLGWFFAIHRSPPRTSVHEALPIS